MSKKFFIVADFICLGVGDIKKSPRVVRTEGARAATSQRTVGPPHCQEKVGTKKNSPKVVDLLRLTLSSHKLSQQ